VVTAGTARVTCGDRVFELCVNESTGIPQGTLHRLENPATAPLDIIEVQCGDYVGEDDIVRLADDYGRTEKR
jgi:mannose-6-phosphate isomerase-like protein (cupin superfamily)